MVDTPAQLIAEYLDAQDIVNFDGNGSTVPKLFIVQGNETHNKLVVVSDTIGGIPDRDDLGLLRESIQITSRDVDGNYNAAYNLQYQIRDAIIQVSGAINSIPSLINVFPTGGILFVGKDDNDRVMFSTNYNLIIKR